MALSDNHLQEVHKNNRPNPRLLIGYRYSAFDPGYYWRIAAYIESLDEYLLVKESKTIANMMPIGYQETKKEPVSDFSTELKRVKTRQDIKNY